MSNDSITTAASLNERRRAVGLTLAGFRLTEEERARLDAALRREEGQR